MHELPPTNLPRADGKDQADVSVGKGTGFAGARRVKAYKIIGLCVDGLICLFSIAAVGRYKNVTLSLDCI